MALESGDNAPAFTLVDQDGKKVKLAELKGRKALVYFYPKADTPGCTAQACGLRDVADEIGDTVILGISPDAPDKQQRFARKYDLPFRLLSDPDHAVADKYGAWGPKKLYGREYEGVIRSAFLIDESGRVEAAWYKISPKATPEKLVAAVG